jgi:AcrR family transcriptional regulator
MQAAGEDIDREGVRFRLLSAAEKLVALRGDGGATNRAIILEAGQRHNSAITYHFGTRRALFDAVWQYRSAAVQRHRTPMLQDLSAPTLDDLVRVFVEPLARHLDETDPSYWARFNEQSLHRYPLQLPAQLRTDLADVEEAPGLLTLLDVFERMQKLTCDGVDPDAGLRVTQAVRAVVTTFAAWERERDGRRQPMTASALAARVIPGIIGLLAAPR